MKTVDGVPQFEVGDLPNDLIKTTANSKLKDWFAKRKCNDCCHCIVNSINHGSHHSWDGSYRCNVLGFSFHNINPDTFSCQAFEPGVTYPIIETIEPIPVLGVLGEEKQNGCTST